MVIRKRRSKVYNVLFIIKIFFFIFVKFFIIRRWIVEIFLEVGIKVLVGSIRVVVIIYVVVSNILLNRIMEVVDWFRFRIMFRYYIRIFF